MNHQTVHGSHFGLWVWVLLQSLALACDTNLLNSGFFFQLHACLYSRMSPKILSS